MVFKDNRKNGHQALNKAAIDFLIKACELVKGQAIALAPVDTGYLRDISIDHYIDEAQLRGFVGSSALYAVYVEFGTGEFAENGSGRKGGWVYKSAKDGKFYHTKGIRPQPYLRPAFRTNKSRIQAIAKDIYSQI